jgi:glycosyltransferase involved in cell wall biosynthesis
MVVLGYIHLMIDKVLIVVPAFNEESSIGEVLIDLKAFTAPRENFDVCVVNDGSFDSTSEIAHRSGVHVLDLPVNLGVGGALRAGYRYALENGFNTVIHFDADGQHQSEYIVEVIKALKDCDFVIGSRYGKESTYPITPMVRIAQLILSLLLRICHGVRLSDPTSGFRGTRGELIKTFSQSYPSPFLADTIGSIIIAANHDYKIREIFTPMKERINGEASHNFFQRCKYFAIAVLLTVLWHERDDRS